MAGDRILFATSEFEDFVRVGGLASVSAALPRALRDISEIRVIIPGYPAVLDCAVGGLEIIAHSQADAALPACQIGLMTTADGLPVYVVICPELYEREGSPYGDATGTDWADNDIRFARFALTAAELSVGLLDRNWRADLVHVNDWQSALVPAYLAWRGWSVPSILTIHNLAYQGLFGVSTLERIGGPAGAFNLNGVEFYNKVSFLKAGLVYATHLTTVSETYAREITTQELGCGLDGLLRQRAGRRELTGILNGIDASWDSRTCAALSPNFSPGDWDAKRMNADQVRRSLGLALSSGPLFALVARLVHQKGVDLIVDAADMIVAAGGQIAITGSGDAELENALKDVSRRHPHAVAACSFDDASARRLFGGSDFTLMPSRFEPCGLSQMYAQRFGSLPIGHATGGLAETIDDGVTGFLFNSPTVESFVGGLRRAFAAFGSASKLNQMRHHAMARTFSWEQSAQNYLNLYKHVAVD